MKGFGRLLNNPLIQTYLPGSCKKIGFHQELLILFWKFCDRNKVSIILPSHLFTTFFFPHRNSCTTSLNLVKYSISSCQFSISSTMLVRIPVSPPPSSPSRDIHLFSENGFNAYWNLYLASTKRRTKFRCSTKQTLHNSSTDGHSCFYWHSCRFTDYRKSPLSTLKIQPLFSFLSLEGFS